ncbi:MAG: hypothetical protein ACM3U2_08655 [Deltaproteobacteria bacterium]
MLRRIVSPLLPLILVLAALPLQAAENALDAVSTDASAVLRLKKPLATIAKVADLADLVVKGSGDQIRQQSAALGLAISNPTLAGVDQESDWWVAVYAKGGEKEPDVVFIVPATDIKAMKEGLGESVKFMENGKLGVYTTDADAATKTAARLKGEGKSISTLIDKDSQAVFDSGDASIFINIPQLAAAYKSDIEEAKQKFTENLENAPIPPGGATGFDPKQAVEVVGKIFAFLVQGMNDTRSCTVAATVSKEGLNFEDLVRLKGGTSTDKLLAKSPPGALGTLSSLPGGNLIYLGLTWDMSEFAKLSQGGGALPGVKPEVAKEIENTTKDFAKLKYGSINAAFGLADTEGGAVRSVSVTEVDDPAKMRELSHKLLKAMGSIETQGIKQTTTVKPDAEKYGKNSADVVTVKTEIDDPQNPLAAFMDRINAGLFGPDGMVTRNVYLKDRVVQTMGGGKQAMTDALAALEKKPADNGKSPVQQTRGKLGAKANVVFLFDLANTVAKILGIAVENQLPLPIDADAVKDLLGKASYFGIGAATEPQGLRVRTHLPVEQMQGVARIVKFFQENMGAGAGGAEEN